MNLITTIIIGLLSGSFVSFCLLKSAMCNFSISFSSKQELLKAVENLNWEDQLNPLIISKIDRYADNLKAKIPMAGAFLKGPFLEIMREQARLDILSGIPELQDKVVSSILENQQMQRSLTEEMKKQITKYQYLIIASGGLIGVLSAVITYLSFV